jgi:hypothetical protein
MKGGTMKKKPTDVFDGEKIGSVTTITPTEYHQRYVNVYTKRRGSKWDPTQPWHFRLSVDVIAEMLQCFIFETKDLWGYDRLIKAHPKGRDETDLMLMKHKLIKST